MDRGYLEQLLVCRARFGGSHRWWGCVGQRHGPGAGKVGVKVAIWTLPPAAERCR